VLENMIFNNTEIVDKGEQQKKIVDCIKSLRKVFAKDQQNFAELCYYTYSLKSLFDGYVYIPCHDKDQNNYDFKSIMRGFGIDETQSSRLCSCFEKYCQKIDNEKPKLLVEFLDFSKSAMYELLPIPTEQIISDIHSHVLKSEMTIKQVRDYVKNYKTMQKQNEKLNNKKKEKEKVVDEDIPEAYNPKQHYDFKYFEKQSKSQLLNMIWELQKEYERLKKSK